MRSLTKRSERSSESTLVFDGRPISIAADDTIASAAFRAGVRTFSRSFKYHRRRGLLCLTGDCPNCLVTVGGEPAVRACVTPGRTGQVVERARGFPGADRDVFSFLWHARRTMPVGFYYKALGRPSWLWPRLEPLVRAMTGLGEARVGDTAPEPREAVHLHPDLLVIGGGVAGLSAALAGSEAGRSVLLVDEGTIGARASSDEQLSATRGLRESLRQFPTTAVWENAAAVGIYDGPLVAVDAPEVLGVVWPRDIVVATGAVERPLGFANNDLPGVWLGRGAALLARAHGLKAGRRAVVCAVSREASEHIASLRSAGVALVAVVTPPGEPELRAPLAAEADGWPVIEGTIGRAVGRKGVTAVKVETAAGTERLRCDAIVLSTDLVPRDSLLRQSAETCVRGAGDVVDPGCTLAEAMSSGRRAASEPTASAPSPTRGRPTQPGSGGFACLCEDVEFGDLQRAWQEGFQSTELLKRYTTLSMGPCQGAMCRAHLQEFVETRFPHPSFATRPTTARPPARPIRLADISAGRRFHIEQRTALHATHLSAGASMEYLGGWSRPTSYSDLADEYAAVRERASIMDVGTLGKFLVAGRDAQRLLNMIYTFDINGLEIGRTRYAVTLNEAGYLLDDGIVCAIGPQNYYITFSSAGADHAESWLREWADRLGLHVYISNETAARGAINLTGPCARSVLERTCGDDLGPNSFPFLHVRQSVVGGVECLIVRLSFLGELSYELHHPSRDSVALWNALLEAGAPEQTVPHGLDALRLLRLEKGNIIVGQDTDVDSAPRHLSLDWLVDFRKESFIGKGALVRHRNAPLRKALYLIRFEESSPHEGSVLLHGDKVVGHLTSSRWSPTLECGVSLGWVHEVNDAIPRSVRTADGAVGTICDEPFYDPSGQRARV